MSKSVLQLLSVTTALALCVGCAGRIDRFTLDRIIPAAVEVPDTGKVCALGESLAHPLAALSKNEPQRALLIAEGVAAVCLQQVAWEADLDAARAKANLGALGAPVVAEITDATLRAERAHAKAAERFERSFVQFGHVWPEAGEGTCPTVKDKDEFAYLFGLVTGTLALLEDRKAGGANDIPLDRLLVVARASECLDSATWWSVPLALRTGAFATIPGSGPDGMDWWKELDRTATDGAASGVRVARAVQVMIGANAGDDGRVAEGLRALAASLEQTPRNPEWALLDAYAVSVALHESDLLWTAAKGHRTETLGVLPSDAADAPVDDPFGEGDPFGGGGDDPFGTPDDGEPIVPDAPAAPGEPPPADEPTDEEPP